MASQEKNISGIKSHHRSLKEPKLMKLKQVSGGTSTSESCSLIQPTIEINPQRVKQNTKIQVTI